MRADDRRYKERGGGEKKKRKRKRVMKKDKEIERERTCSWSWSFSRMTSARVFLAPSSLFMNIANALSSASDNFTSASYSYAA